MPTPANAFKEALAARRAQLGLWLAFADGYAAAVAASTGYDWLCIDAEHAPNTLPSIVAQLQAIAAAPAPTAAVIRMPDGNPTFIKQVLDAGGSNLLIPMVESAGQARELVRAVRYPPQGIRGMGGSLGRATQWGLQGDYFQRASELVCLGVQLESPAGIEAAAGIAAVDGVDFALIGPGDLATHMGLMGQTSHPQVRARVEQAIAAVSGAGKPVGVYVGDESLARAYLAAGACFVALGSDVGLYTRAARELSARFRASLAGQSAPATAAPPGGGSGY